MPSKAVKVDEELYRRAAELANKKGIDIKDVVEDALKKYFGIIEGVEGDRDIKDVKIVKNWTLKYPTLCAYCKKELNAGERVVREIIELEDGRRVNNFYHPECYVFSTDSALAKYYLKKRQLEKVIRALKRQADELADVLIEAEARRRVLDVAMEVQRVAQGIEKSVLKVCDMVREWLLTVDASNEDLKAIREELAKLNESVQSQLDALKRKLDEIAAAFMSKPKRKRKEVEVL